MRCQLRGEPCRVLYRVSLLLLWILHSVLGQDRSMTSEWEFPGSITTNTPTQTIGHGTNTGRFLADHVTRHGLSHDIETVVTSIDRPLSDSPGRHEITTSEAVPASLHSLTRESVTSTDIKQEGLPVDEQTSARPSVEEQTSAESADAGIVPSTAETNKHFTPSLPKLSKLAGFSSPSVPITSSSSSLTSPDSSDISSDVIYKSESDQITSESPLSHHGAARYAASSPSSFSSVDITSSLKSSSLSSSEVELDDKDSLIHSNSSHNVSAEEMDPSAVTSSFDAARTTTQNVDVNMTKGRDTNFTEVTPSGEMWNQTSVLPTDDEEEGLSVGATVGISIACILFVISGVLIGLALLYHRHRTRKLDTTKTANSHYTGLWDDNVTLSYINNHFDFFQKDVQDEMISLDNDAYLNSLEFMVFTNTWGDGKRNTRF